MVEIKCMVAMIQTVGAVSLLLVACFIEAVVSEKCYRDESLGERDGNIYQCDNKDLSSCCVQNGIKTCCMSEVKKNLTEQLQLWGAVAGFLVLIIIIFFCCKNDISFCKSDLSLKERWQNFRHKDKNREAHIIEKDEQNRGTYYDNPIGDFGGPSNYFPPIRDPYNFPPLSPDQRMKNYNMNQSYA